MIDANAARAAVAVRRLCRAGLRGGRSRRAAVCALLAGFALLLAGDPAQAEDVLRILVGGSYPPFEYYETDGSLSGFDIDFAKALCAVLAVRCAFVDVPFEETIPALMVGKGDAIISSLSITEERKKLVAFTNHYYRTPMQFVARKGFAHAMTPEGLSGLSIGVTPGTTNERYARQKFGATARIMPLTGDQDVLYQALIQGSIDLALSDSLAMWRFTASPEGKDFAFVGEPIYVDEAIGIAVRKEDEALRERLNAAIARIRLDGTYQKINAKYFPFSIY